MESSVQGKVCFITGGASGIGEALCHNFAMNGAKAIAVVDLNAENAARVASAIKACPAIAITADCGSSASLKSAVEKAQKELGDVDVCIANAGYGGVGGPEQPDEHFLSMHAVNTMQVVYLARYLVPGMLKRGGGHFVVTASAAGLLSQIGSLAYAMTKHAAVSVAEWLSITYGAQGLQVACLCPQAVNTPMIAGVDNGGVAGVDGLVEADTVAQDVLNAMNEKRFLVLPHKEVLKYMQRKTADYDRWLNGMQRLNSRFMEVQHKSRL